MSKTSTKLKRELGLLGSIMMGLGSIIGTGVFVSISIGVEIAGASVVFAILVAGLVAICNALSSAQLAANHPTSGGTYEYGYQYLSPTLGFAAGWMFLCAKSASAASAALGFAGYALALFGSNSPQLLIILATTSVIAVSVLVLSGIRRSNTTNIVIVSLTITSLLVFIVLGLPDSISNWNQNLFPFFYSASKGGSISSYEFLRASALMFVAYTGYGRIATLGEEVVDPRKTIPKAIIATLAISMFIYLTVALVGVSAAGQLSFSLSVEDQTAPLVIVAKNFSYSQAAWILSLGAITAMLGVLLNLVLGLSRVALAMGRRGDLPGVFALIDRKGQTPYIAVIAISLPILAMVYVGSIKYAWSFSAFTVLIYYAVTNLAALTLPKEQQLYPKWIASIGLLGCLGLAFWIELRICLLACLVLFFGFAFRLAVHSLTRS